MNERKKNTDERNERRKAVKENDLIFGVKTGQKNERK